MHYLCKIATKDELQKRWDYLNRINPGRKWIEFRENALKHYDEKSTIPMGFKTRFRELRESRGLSQAATDEVFGLMRGTSSNWENGFSEPEEELIEDIARFFGVRIRDLVEEA